MAYIVLAYIQVSDSNTIWSGRVEGVVPERSRRDAPLGEFRPAHRPRRSQSACPVMRRPYSYGLYSYGLYSSTSARPEIRRRHGRACLPQQQHRELRQDAEHLRRRAVHVREPIGRALFFLSISEHADGARRRHGQPAPGTRRHEPRVARDCRAEDWHLHRPWLDGS